MFDCVESVVTVFVDFPPPLSRANRLIVEFEKYSRRTAGATDRPNRTREGDELKAKERTKKGARTRRRRSLAHNSQADGHIRPPKNGHKDMAVKKGVCPSVRVRRAHFRA